MKKLDRDLGLVSVIAIAIGSMIGGGIFVLPGLAAAKTGASVWLAYFLAGLIVVPAALCQAEMATAMPQAGGVYVFVDRILGPMYGTIAGFGTWLAMLFKASFALVGISVYLSMFTTVSYKPVAFSLLVLVTVLNVVGVKKVGKAQIVIVIACIISLGMLIFKGAGQMNPAHFKVHFSGGMMGLISTTGLVFISYAGVTKIASIAEEIIDPARNLPLAMMVSLGLMMLLYSTVALILVGVMPMEPSTWWGSTANSLAHNERAIASLGAALYGTPGKVGMAVIAVIALASMANAGLLASSRYPLAMSRDGMVPEIFQRINERFVTPLISIVFTAGCMCLAIAFLPVVKIAKLASGMQVLLFLAINVSVLILRQTHPQWYKPKFSAPFYPGLQIFGILGSLMLLVMLGTFVLTGTAILLLVGVGWYFYYAARKTQRRGIIQKMRGMSKKAQVHDDDDAESIEVGAADLVIPLSGDEFSPESLLAIGSAFGARKISVLDLVEVPDQLVLSRALLEETPRMQSLRRRIQLMSERLSIQAEVDFIASHDRRHALYHYITQSKAPCVLVDMGPHQNFHRVRKYLGWLAGHLPCHLAVYQNEGFRITKNILVLVGESPDDPLVVDISNRLAEMFDANLKLLTVISEHASDVTAKAARLNLEELEQLCTVAHIETDVMRGDLFDVVIQESIMHELLVMGYPSVEPLRWYRSRSAHDRLMAEVACSVLSIKPATGEERTPFLLSSDSLQLPDLLDPRTIRTRDHVESKEELFEHFAQLFAKVTHKPVEELEKALHDGETEDSQILGGGVALLHATLNQLEKTYLGMLILDAPLDNEEFEKIDIIMLTIGPSSQEAADRALRLNLTTLLSDERFLVRLRDSSNTKEILRLFRNSYDPNPDLSVGTEDESR